MSDGDSVVVRGRPGDDWPGIPGVEWGMGSRVIVKTHSMGELSGQIVGASSIPRPLCTLCRRPPEAHDGRDVPGVVEAHAFQPSALASSEGWRIHVRLDAHVELYGRKAPPSAFLPSEILRLASAPDR